jgi:hypothetical protein
MPRPGGGCILLSAMRIDMGPDVPAWVFKATSGMFGASSMSNLQRFLDHDRKATAAA